MRIIIDTRFLRNEMAEEYSYYTSALFEKIAKQHTDHHFIFIRSQQAAQEVNNSDNITIAPAWGKLQRPGLKKLIQDTKRTSFLKKQKADLLICCDIAAVAPARLPQLLFLPGLSGVDKNRKALQQVNTIIVSSAALQDKLINEYAVAADKTAVITSGRDELFETLSPNDKSLVQEKYTERKEFFIYQGPVSKQANLITLLKAFSVFKKRQRSSMKFIIAGKVDEKYQSFTEQLNAYKYREDVLLLQDLQNEERKKLVAASYALVYSPVADVTGAVLINAMQYGTAVITSGAPVMQEITKGNALYAEGESYEALAEKMMLLYKDEGKRARLAEDGPATAAQYSWEDAAQKLWQLVEKSIR